MASAILFVAADRSQVEREYQACYDRNRKDLEANLDREVAFQELID